MLQYVGIDGSAAVHARRDLEPVNVHVFLMDHMLRKRVKRPFALLLAAEHIPRFLRILVLRQVVLPGAPDKQASRHIGGRRGAREARDDDFQREIARNVLGHITLKEVKRFFGGGGKSLVVAAFAGGKVSTPLEEIVGATNAH